MRAKEFIISIDTDETGEPTNVTVQPLRRPKPAPRHHQAPEYDDSEYDDDDLDCDYEDDPEADDAAPLMVTPQQQEIELIKAALGKKSVVGAQLTDDAEDGEVS